MLGISDHDIVSFNLKVHCQRKRPAKRKIYIRKKADHDKVKQELNKFSEYYVNSLKDEPIDVKWDEFETTVKHIMNTCIPDKLTSSRYNLPWFNRHSGDCPGQSKDHITKGKNLVKTPTDQSIEI